MCDVDIFWQLQFRLNRLAQAESNTESWMSVRDLNSYPVLAIAKILYLLIATTLFAGHLPSGPEGEMVTDGDGAVSSIAG